MIAGKGLCIDGNWRAGEAGDFASYCPWDGESLWRGAAASTAQVDAAVRAARRALPQWAGRSVAERRKVLTAFAEQLAANRADLARTIALETGKPLWEADTEISSMIGKLPLTLEAFQERRSHRRIKLAEATGETFYKPHGVTAVFGPFNMPGHLPNGHIMPALLAGNTIIYKPSELTPWMGQRTAELWQNAGLPPGVLNLVQGGREAGVDLARHSEVDAIFFTGSFATGQALLQMSLPFPQRMLVLEMGGNNPLVIFDCAEIQAAAYTTVISAFLTAGQRCTCARRLIVSDDAAGERLIAAVVDGTRRIRLGGPLDQPEPFMGTVITAAAAEKVLAAQRALIARGARLLLEARRLDGRRPALLSPGILDATAAIDRPDEEVFGPLLQVIRVADFAAALREANRTRFGLSAALLSDRADLWGHFRNGIRAGVVHFNRPTNGASGALPFGGVGCSGNHRPSGYWAADYCSYPVACLATPRLAMPKQPLPGCLEDGRSGARLSAGERI